MMDCRDARKRPGPRKDPVSLPSRPSPALLCRGHGGWGGVVSLQPLFRQAVMIHVACESIYDLSTLSNCHLRFRVGKFRSACSWRASEDPRKHEFLHLLRFQVPEPETSSFLAHATQCRFATDRLGLVSSREALLLDPRYDNRVKMAFWSIVCRGARSRAYRALRQLAFFMGGDHEQGSTILEAHIQRHCWCGDIESDRAATRNGAMVKEVIPLNFVHCSILFYIP